MEFARAMACLGKLNSPEMRRARSAELAEMATIKGKTISELEREIAETQEELTKVRNKLLFLAVASLRFLLFCFVFLSFGECLSCDAHCLGLCFFFC